MLSIGLDQGTLGFLMAAGLLTVIGWAMREAAAVKAENAAFV
jgi:ABC-type transport system involved in cytochrome bd biosynthesis fused ATPase/permease subunit